jgi:hypothetical protein
MAIELVKAGSNDVRTNIIGPVLGCLPLKTSSGDDDVMVCVLGWVWYDKKLSNFRNYELLRSIILMRGQLGIPFCSSLQFWVQRWWMHIPFFMG